MRNILSQFPGRMSSKKRFACRFLRRKVFSKL